MRQIQGESLNIGSVADVGACYYYQKQFFTGEDNPLSKPDRRMHSTSRCRAFRPATPAIWCPRSERPGLSGDAPNRGLRPGICPFSSGRSRRAPSSASRTRAGAFRCRIARPELRDAGVRRHWRQRIHRRRDALECCGFISTIDTRPSRNWSIWYHTLNVGSGRAVAAKQIFRASTTAASASAARTRRSTAA